ncbi:MAG: hypothetical protein IIZ12_03475 [Eggerthellaceae bacterium]|nr:hypothetical protein [Eggerthellaceae bacterium]
MNKTTRPILTVLLAIVVFAIAFFAQPSISGNNGLTNNPTTASSSASSSTTSASISASSATSTSQNLTVKEDGEYTSKDEVALYIHLYGHVPSNYITKTKARRAGWVNTEGNLWDILPGKSIGGGGYSNDDGALPDAPGREWFECDIDYDGGYRNSKRIVYSNDGLIFYTGDHYNTFEQLY